MGLILTIFGWFSEIRAWAQDDCVYFGAYRQGVMKATWRFWIGHSNFWSGDAWVDIVSLNGTQRFDWSCFLSGSGSFNAEWRTIKMNDFQYKMEAQITGDTGWSCDSDSNEFWFHWESNKLSGEVLDSGEWIRVTGQGGKIGTNTLNWGQSSNVQIESQPSIPWQTWIVTAGPVPPTPTASRSISRTRSRSPPASASASRTPVATPSKVFPPSAKEVSARIARSAVLAVTRPGQTGVWGSVPVRTLELVSALGPTRLFDATKVTLSLGALTRHLFPSEGWPETWLDGSEVNEGSWGLDASETEITEAFGKTRISGSAGRVSGTIRESAVLKGSVLGGSEQFPGSSRFDASAAFLSAVVPVSASRYDASALSAGAWAGIGVGILGLLAVAGLVILLLLRKKREETGDVEKEEMAVAFQTGESMESEMSYMTGHNPNTNIASESTIGVYSGDEGEVEVLPNFEGAWE